MIRVESWIFGLFLLGVMLSIIYYEVSHPWKLVRGDLRDFKGRLRKLERLDGRFARLYAFMIAPWLKGDVEKTREFLSERIKLKQAELELFEKFRRVGNDSGCDCGQEENNEGVGGEWNWRG